MSRLSLTIAILFALATSAAADIQYKSATTLSTGENAQNASDIAAGDVNGDGFVDLIVANRGGSAAAKDGSAVVLLGDGAGGFGAPTPIHTGTLDRPIALAVKDLDGDGKLDIAVATLGSDGVLVFFGAGNGTFSTPTSRTVGNAPQALAVGDFNSDSRPDILVSNQEDDTVTLLLNSGGRQFVGSSIDVKIASKRTKPQGVAVGDFDGNTSLDAAVVVQDQDQVAILIGDGHGTFGPPRFIDVGTTAPVAADPKAIVAADLNGDGHLDLAVANTIGDSVTILKNDGAGNFTNLGDFAAGNNPSGLVAADLDGDGILDLATANFEGDNVTVL